MAQICDQEIRDLLGKQAIVEILDNQTVLYTLSLLFHKKWDLFRPIVNLKPFNNYIRYRRRKFKMENLETVWYFLKKENWMAKMDLKDAYLTVLLHRSCTQFIHFDWRERVFEFKCLAFGLAPAGCLVKSSIHLNTYVSWRLPTKRFRWGIRRQSWETSLGRSHPSRSPSRITEICSNSILLRAWHRARIGVLNIFNLKWHD